MLNPQRFTEFIMSSNVKVHKLLRWKQKPDYKGLKRELMARH
jgi:hypothetical protein